MAAFLQDFKLGVRLLVRHRGFTVVAALVLQVVLELGFYPLSRQKCAVLRREEGADALHVCPEEVPRQALLAGRVGVRERLRNPPS